MVLFYMCCRHLSIRCSVMLDWLVRGFYQKKHNITKTIVTQYFFFGIFFVVPMSSYSGEKISYCYSLSRYAHPARRTIFETEYLYLKVKPLVLKLYTKTKYFKAHCFFHPDKISREARDKFWLIQKAIYTGFRIQHDPISVHKHTRLVCMALIKIWTRIYSDSVWNSIQCVHKKLWKNSQSETYIMQQILQFLWNKNIRFYFIKSVQ